MACDNCFNGCVETTSDKCVKYTGLDYPELNIHNGDSLAAIENSLIVFIKSALDGTGIILDISDSTLCVLVKSFLPVSGDINLVHYVTALIKSVCSLQTQITATQNSINNIEANYNVGCLTGVTATSGTHNIVQATINLLCTVNSNLGLLAGSLNNYVLISELDTYITNYISTAPAATAIKSRMVPNTAVEYYGSLSVFDATGKGTGDWAEIYLCNGSNGTPDKRGRSPIGVTNMLGTAPYSPIVDPAQPGNPTYSLLSTGGSNRVTLSIQQMPAHTHTITVAPVGDHTHNQTGKVRPGSQEGNGGNDDPVNGDYPTSPAGAHTHTATAAPSGESLPHPNVHPVIACYYIIYIPNP